MNGCEYKRNTLLVIQWKWRAITTRRKAWFHLHMSRILFAATQLDDIGHDQTIIWGSYFQVTWMLTDKLKLNDEKTELMLMGTKQQLSKANIDCFTVGSIDIAPITVARNLGTRFDSNLNLPEQIHKTCKSGFFHLYSIRHIRKVCTNFGPCFYYWSYRLLQQPSIWFTLCSST